MAESSLRVAIIMGSKSDWDTMRLASETLTKLQITHESRVLSAHRASDALGEYVRAAEAGGVQVFIAGAGGAASTSPWGSLRSAIHSAMAGQ